MPARLATSTRLHLVMLAPGICFAALTWPVVGIVVLFVVVALVTAISHSSLVVSEDTRPAERNGASWNTLDFAALSGLTVVSVSALAQISTSLALLVGATLLAISHRARALLRMRYPGIACSAVAPPAAPQPRPAVPQPRPPLPGRTDRDPALLSPTQLCDAWRRSYLLLDQARTIHQHARIVTRRQALLDEMERRDAEGLQAWLHADARPATAPDRYLRDTEPPAPST